MINNIFTNTARLYDLDMLDMANHDIRFYHSYAAALKSPILELACGTGRVSIPLAHAGHDVVGLDLSPAMLSVFHQKLRYLPTALRSRITTMCADMADFDLRRRFALIIIPFRGFQALTDERAISSCLAAIRRHLIDGGLCIIDLMHVSSALRQSWFAARLRWQRHIHETGQTITRMRVDAYVDKINEYMGWKDIYTIEDPDGKQTTISDTFMLKFYRRIQAQIRWCAAGFRIMAEYGDYDKRPIGTGGEQIYVLKKA